MQILLFFLITFAEFHRQELTDNFLQFYGQIRIVVIGSVASRTATVLRGHTR